MYSSSLSTNNQIYNRNCDKEYFYYESIQVKVKESGYYSFDSHSSMDVYEFLYRNRFNPLNPAENLLLTDVESSPYFQFKLNVYLSNDTTYVLVITTYRLKETGTFSITVLGNEKVILERLSKYIYVLILSSENAQSIQKDFLLVVLIVIDLSFPILSRYSSEHSIDIFVEINC